MLLVGEPERARVNGLAADVDQDVAVEHGVVGEGLDEGVDRRGAVGGEFLRSGGHAGAGRDEPRGGGGGGGRDSWFPVRHPIRPFQLLMPQRRASRVKR